MFVHSLHIYVFCFSESESVQVYCLSIVYIGIAVGDLVIGNLLQFPVIFNTTR